MMILKIYKMAFLTVYKETDMQFKFIQCMVSSL